MILLFMSSVLCAVVMCCSVVVKLGLGGMIFMLLGEVLVIM